MAKKKTSRKKSRPWTAQEAGDILDQIESLGVNDSEFARQRGLKIGRIAWWRQQLGRQRRVRHKAPPRPLAVVKNQASFVELKAAPLDSQVHPEPRIEVRLRNGRSVFLPVRVDHNQLAALLDIIDGKSC